ncbi:hypothetical protein [Nostoc sp. FACHB-888]|uniref:hypothetical protein n=1 Tax=Nostoc sp. FACHB-888 TaxID=2692842 RepID=UPI001F54DD42|nr:hypothetical protein [Nostoc sp. FACHB-888]
MWSERQIFITREKGSDSGVHPLRDDELELLKQLRRTLAKVFCGMIRSLAICD